MEEEKNINSLISGIDTALKNNTSDIYLNMINNEFIKINGIITIPKIPVSELRYDTAREIVNDVKNYIPEFLVNHSLLVKRKPSSEQHHLHFIQSLKGKHIYFLHIFKLDFEFGGNPENIVQQGDSDNYPSYKTDRLYYKSKLIPITSTLKKGESVIDFTTIRLVQKEKLESDQHFHTFAIFDESDTRENSRELTARAGLDKYGISPKLYPFITYEYFTAVFNILYPVPEEIERALTLFEPLFIYLYAQTLEWKNLVSPESLSEKFHDRLVMKDGIPVPTETFQSEVDDYFKDFSLFRDDDMALRGWRRFDMSR